MRSGSLGTLQGATLTDWGTDVTSTSNGGKPFLGVNTVECIEDGDIDVVWNDDSTQTISRTSGWVNPIDCKTVIVSSGKWVFAKV